MDLARLRGQIETLDEYLASVRLNFEESQSLISLGIDVTYELLAGSFSGQETRITAKPLRLGTISP